MEKTEKIEKKGKAPVIFMMAANFLVKFAGLLREILIAKFYGTSIYTDAYIIANSIPTVLFSALSSAIATTFVPMYARISVEKDEKRANSFTLHLIEVMCVICLVLTILGEIFVKEIVLVFAPGFSAEALQMTESYVRILLPSIFGTILFNLQGAYMQLHEKYLPYALVPAIGNIVIIGFLLVAKYCGDIRIFVWGTLIGLVSQVAFYLPWSIRLGLFRARWTGLREDHYVRKLVPLLLPVFIGGAVNEVNSMIDKSLVSGLDTGSVAALNYGYKVISLVTTVVVAAIVSYEYPKLSKLASKGDLRNFKEKGQTTINSMFAIVFPISVIVIVFRTEIVRILFQRGSFDETSVRLTASALAFYAVGIAAIGLRDILVKMFYSLQNTRTPMINGICAAIVNICMDLILIRVMGHKGAALATSLAAIASVVILSVLLHKRKHLSWKGTIPSLFKSLLSGIVAGAGLYIAYQRFLNKDTITISYLAVCAAFMVIYLAADLLLQIVLKNPILKLLMKNLAYVRIPVRKKK